MAHQSEGRSGGKALAQVEQLFAYDFHQLVHPREMPARSRVAPVAGKIDRVAKDAVAGENLQMAAMAFAVVTEAMHKHGTTFGCPIGFGDPTGNGRIGTGKEFV